MPRLRAPSRFALESYSLVGDRSARPDVGSDIEENLEIATITGFAAGQMKRERQPVEIDLEVDFRREAAARAAERLPVLDCPASCSLSAVCLQHVGAGSGRLTPPRPQ